MQIWLAEVLIEYCCKEREKAEQIEAKFEGFGPSLYLRKFDNWCALLGPYGPAVHAILLEKCYDEGAMPKGYDPIPQANQANASE